MDDGHFDGLSSLVRLSGISNRIPSRARFTGEAVLAATFSSITLGLVCGQAGALFMATSGPVVPFLVGSWAGYTFGLAAYWHSSVKWCDTVARRYPKMLIHALRTHQPYAVEVVPPKEVDDDGGRLVDWVKQGSLSRLSFCVLAAQACRGDVEEIERAKCQRLMEEYQEMGKEEDGGEE